MVVESHKLNRYSHLWLTLLRSVIGLITYLLCAFCQPVFAQLCANPSGPLVINQTFGTASQPISMEGLTPYQYVPPTCPSDGQYTITSTIDGSCFSYTWYALASDHTAEDVDGNMLIVNGANTPGVFYQQPVTGLCGGTSYEISFWALNLLKPGICPDPIVPNLTVNIDTKDGQTLSSTVIGSIDLASQPTWRRYSALFTAPKTTEELVIKLMNLKGDFGCGNDMVIDDIQVRQCDECMSDQIFVPDVFTPNNDGLNDDLTFFLPRVASFNLNIYNRWGNLIFNTNTLQQKWNGTYAGSDCPSGAYTWVISYKPIQGTQEQREHIQTGHVLLLR